MSRFTLTPLPLSSLTLVERQRIQDNRGFLSRLFCADELRTAGWTKAIAQINHTSTRKRGTVRGMHFQSPPHAEMKLVTCMRGEIWDVAVDLRPDSKTYLTWHAELLSADNCRALLIPEGFAHGFQAMTDDVEILYCHSEAHHPDAESGLNPNDPRLSIAWPLPISEISPKDIGRPMIDSTFQGVRL